MNDATSTIIFEHPLNEKMRSWLRIESSLQQLETQSHLDSQANSLAFFRTIAELIEILERGEVRSELLKELERQQIKLRQWLNAPNVDTTMVHSLVEQLKERSLALHHAPRLSQQIKEDRIISMVRQRLSIPGGCCSFDLPTLYLWLHLPQSTRDETVSSWLNSLLPLKQALESILELIRQSTMFSSQVSHNGFFQGNAGDADLLRLKLDISENQLIYPQVSGHKTRFAIRFLPMDSENGTVPAHLSFELACC
ncbi:cell division protein ZapD [Xenorhabdus stockiae]|uniref:Cell division protein ZapD n=1 Tax=Xenorhabdus stockiae TaxID=351614 RepID=A0A2D0KN71_9GAMM|nr:MULTISPECIES: cell division protein ZapD [Xenorhabdus]PHM64856.1 cell division protein ZapD [Xenorhabdus stockiae]PHM68193.1 cell division protein ZapD [Xenorhabdus sp. KJ12.1]